jgi:ABC-type glycerol-3-phosphate transport system permease component
MFKIKRNTNVALSVFEYIVMYGWLIIILFPFAWILSLALRKTELVYNTLFFPKEYTFENFIYLFKGQFPWKNMEINFLGSLGNSIIVSIVTVILIIIISIIAAYGFAKTKFFAKKASMIIILSGLMIPVQVIMLPLLQVVNFIKISGSLLSIILPYVALGAPLSIFLFTGFFKNIPTELIEAARIEGYNEWQILFKVVVPLAKPALGANIILQFLFAWNEFGLALVLLNKPENFTLQVEISKFVGQYMTPWNIIAVAILCGMLPVLIVYIIFQKSFISGLTMGALKE